VFAIAELATRLFSPYELNPLNINPLRDALTASVDFEVLRASKCPTKLFVSATNVRTVRWLAANFDLLGCESTIELQKEFL
jgi:NTE family protein